MLEKKLQKITLRLNKVKEVKELSIEELEFLRDVMDKNLEELIGFEPHQVIEMINIIVDVNTEDSLKNIYAIGKALHGKKLI